MTDVKQKLRVRLSIEGRSGRVWHFLLDDMRGAVEMAEDGIKLDFVRIPPQPKEYQMVDTGAPPQGETK
jgi:hypothetical protein